MREEMERVLPKVALDRGLSTEECMLQWKAYKNFINIREGEPAHLAKYLSGVDPDDAPTLALAETLRACGIVSRDRHIQAMGGTVIPVEFVYDVRGYSRKACVSLTIKMCGYTLVVSTVAAARIGAILLRQAAAGFMRLPDGVKLLILVTLALMLLNPKSRATIAGWLQRVLETASDIGPQAFSGMMGFAKMAIENEPVIPALPAGR